MKSPYMTLTSETELFDFTEEQERSELPSLPLSVFTDREEFDKKVQALLKEQEAQKPVGIFF